MHRLFLFLLIISTVHAQVLHGSLVREISHGFEKETEIALFNAIKIRPDYALAPAHAFLGTEIKLTINGKPAQLVTKLVDFALIRINPSIKTPYAKISNPWTIKNRYLTHRYYDHATHKIVSRIVEFDDTSYIINSACEYGMSGSGIYTEEGELVAVAEWTTGFCWNTIHIAGFIEYTLGD